MSEVVPEVWDEIAGQYEAGVAIAAIARSFNVSRARIKRKADELGWTHRQAGNGGSASKGNSSGPWPGAQKAAVASAPHKRSTLIEQQRVAWDNISAMREDAYRLLRGEEPQIIKVVSTDDVSERLSIAAKLLTMVDKDANSLMRAQEGQRRAYGFDYKQQEAETKDDEADRERRFRRLESIIKEIDDFKRQQANCRCYQESCRRPIDTVSQSAPESGQDAS